MSIINRLDQATSKNKMRQWLSNLHSARFYVDDWRFFQGMKKYATGVVNFSNQGATYPMEVPYASPTSTCSKYAKPVFGGYANKMPGDIKMRVF